MIKFGKNIELWLLILLLSCDSMENLENGYYYVSPFDVLDNGFPYGSLVYKSYRMNAFQHYIVWSEVVDIKSTDRYILVKQNPNFLKFKEKILNQYEIQQKNRLKADTLINSIYKSDMQFVSDHDVNRMNHFFEKMNFKFSDDQLDSMLNSVPNIYKYFKNNTNYFLIDKNIDTVSAPLNHEQFKKLIKEKGITEIL